MPRWVPLESNPRALTALAHRLGVPPGLAFADILSLDDWALGMLPRPVVGVLLLYPLTPALLAAHPTAPAADAADAADAANAADASSAGTATPPSGSDGDAAAAGKGEPWYLTQVVSNACGTIGVLHAGANAATAYGDAYAPVAGSFLASFMDRTRSMGAAARGAALEAEEALGDIHAAAAADGETPPPPPEEDVDTHFVAFVEGGGGGWECDGRKGRPVWRAACAPGGLMEAAAKVIKKEFMEKDPSTMRFTMLALAPVQD